MDDSYSDYFMNWKTYVVLFQAWKNPLRGNNHEANQTAQKLGVKPGLSDWQALERNGNESIYLPVHGWKCFNQRCRLGMRSSPLRI
jgi:hypothetical protein